MVYDPVKAHEYYLRTRELKGREPAKGQVKVAKPAAKVKPKPSRKERDAAVRQVAVITGKIKKLNKALKEARQLLSEKRRKAEKSRASRKKAEKKNSDGKTTAKEKLASKKYREKNKGKLASKSKKESKKPADMSVEELEERVDKIETAIKTAKSDLKKAMATANSLKHSSIDVNSSEASSFGVGQLQGNQLRKETVKMAGANKASEADFGGYATKAGLECADGLTIQKDAFKHQDGIQVPLVWQHGHNSPSNILGHAILENRDDGVYAHCFFNTSKSAQDAKEAVVHEDITQMSIYANHLAKKAKTVIHGMIREVSLVMAGANPGALIDYVSVQHSDGIGGYEVETLEDEAVIFTGLTLQHADGSDDSNGETESDDEDDPEEIYESMTDKQKEVVHQMLASVAAAAAHDDTDPDPDDEEENEDDDESNSDDSDDSEGETDDQSAKHDDLNHNDPEGQEMTHNVFDKKADKDQDKGEEGYVLTHDDMSEVFRQGQVLGSLKEAAEQFGLKHGIDNIDILFPDARAVSDTPEWIKRRTEWVARVLSGTRHTPFSRIKSLSADLTLEQARAKGYIKGSLKKEEFFSLAKRVTTPQTIYKKQKLDRDDILDITDFDVVAWLKGEMRIMLDEEIARAVLIGDGRSNADDDKILEDKIRPIATDHELYQTTITLNLGDANSSPEEIVDALLLNRRYYRGSGNPDFFTTEETIARILNVKDTTGRRIYQNINDLAVTLRVNQIIPVEVMEEQTDLIGIMVNLQDYTIGADRGGDVAMFDDFDIDYNQQKYLIETRISGALTKAKSAIVVRRSADNATQVTPVAPTWNAADHEITVPTVTGLVYKNTNGAILDPEVPVTLSEGQQYTVVAVPTSSAYYLASSEVDEFTFDYEDGLIDGPH